MYLELEAAATIEVDRIASGCVLWCRVLLLPIASNRSESQMTLLHLFHTHQQGFVANTVEPIELSSAGKSTQCQC